MEAFLCNLHFYPAGIAAFYKYMQELSLPLQIEGLSEGIRRK